MVIGVCDVLAGGTGAQQNSNLPFLIASGVALLVLVGIILFLLWRRRRKNEDDQPVAAKPASIDFLDDADPKEAPKPDASNTDSV
jgi:LPXTG-motif cell wall-anchored protein